MVLGAISNNPYSRSIFPIKGDMEVGGKGSFRSPAVDGQNGVNGPTNYSPNGDLVARLDAMGDGELHPRTDRKFDIMA